MHKIISPLAVFLPRIRTKDKKMILNFNVVNGLHYIAYNDMKIQYSKHMRPQLEGLKFIQASLIFKYFKGTKRKCDRANIYSIHEKFFCDALVNHGVIEDDSDVFIIETHYAQTQVDQDNPRVEIFITEAKSAS